MNKQTFIDTLELVLISSNYPRNVTRRGRKMIEANNSQLILSDVSNVSEFRQEEYDQYLEMITPQVERFKKYFNLDKYSRRLLIQFPANWYEDKEQDYMPCPESFLVQFVDEDTYEVMCNFRSSEVSRIPEDLAIIKKFCEDVLDLASYRLLTMRANFMNVHKYLDGGSSEDFTAKTYFEVKNE